MNNKVYDFGLNIDWKLINLISETDRFDANWTAIERKEGQSLKELTSIATMRSVGASNRIESNKMSDEEVDVLLQKIDITKLTGRDSQEVVEYFEALDLISESYENMAVSESHIKSLHNTLMKYSSKDKLKKNLVSVLSGFVNKRVGASLIWLVPAIKIVRQSRRWKTAKLTRHFTLCSKLRMRDFFISAG